MVELLRLFAPLPRKLSGDAFGLIHEDFLSNFVMAGGRLGGEFFTPCRIEECTLGVDLRGNSAMARPRRSLLLWRRR